MEPFHLSGDSLELLVISSKNRFNQMFTGNDKLENYLFRLIDDLLVPDGAPVLPDSQAEQKDKNQRDNNYCSDNGPAQRGTHGITPSCLAGLTRLPDDR
jgi:hypothetical protein